jgi:protein-tyrosine phosphatase
VAQWASDDGVLVLPSGVRVRGRPLTRDATPADFTLVLADGPRPDWEYREVRWPDFGVPADTTDAVAALRDAWRRAQAGLRVEAACLGGAGRTGTALAALAVLDGLDRRAAVDWVRAGYLHRAVETPWQARWLRHIERARG